MAALARSEGRSGCYKDGGKGALLMNVKQLAELAERATAAPSIHNSQPWRLRVGENRIEVCADRTRALPIIDPAGRQLHISCGALIEYARLEILAAGFDCDVRLLVVSDDPDQLAELTVGGSREAADDENQLVSAMARRHTHREPFDPRPIPQELIDRFRADVSAAGGWLHPIRDPDDLIMTAVLLSHAEDAERDDPAYLAELSRWVGVVPSESEGIPDDALSRVPVGERASMLQLRNFLQTSHAEHAASPPPVERPLIVLLGTDTDDRRAWLLAGQALARLLLRAAANDVYASPLNQVLDQPGFRARFAHALRLIGYPQMLLRMGFAQAATSTTGRRAAVEVIP